MVDHMLEEEEEMALLVTSSFPTSSPTTGASGRRGPDSRSYLRVVPNLEPPCATWLLRVSLWAADLEWPLHGLSLAPRKAQLGRLFAATRPCGVKHLRPLKKR